MSMRVVTYKFRLKDRHAAKRLRVHSYACNQVWNWCVAQQRDLQDRWRAGAKPRQWSTRFDLQRMCKGVGAELGIHQQTAQEVCRLFTISRDKIKRAPNFRSSFGTGRALGWIPFTGQCRQIEGNSITYLGKTYRWFGNKRRPLPANAKSGAFAEDTLGRWWVCFSVEVPEPAQALGPAIGIDLGLKSLATLSDGRTFDNVRPLRQLADKLAIAQRAGNMLRAKSIHAKIANVRKDHLHKITTSLARSNAFIAVGNVNAKKLVKTRMAKSVLDAGWSTFRKMLAYKSAGFIEVDEKFTTQTCSCCGVIPDSSPKGRASLGIRSWTCSACGGTHDRDVNSALNILRIGRSAAPLVGESRGIAA